MFIRGFYYDESGYPVAGLGTRIFTCSKSIPKKCCLLLIAPLIQYIVEECVRQASRNYFITHSSKNSIADHFDTSFEFENITGTAY